MKNYDFSLKNTMFFHYFLEYLSSKTEKLSSPAFRAMVDHIFMKNSIYIPACRFFLIKKSIKNDEKSRFFIKKIRCFFINPLSIFRRKTRTVIWNQNSMSDIIFSWKIRSTYRRVDFFSLIFIEKYTKKSLIFVFIFSMF